MFSSHRRSGLAHSPPLAFEGAVCAVGLVERIEPSHVLICQGEVEDLRVSWIRSRWVDLGMTGRIVLNAPTQEHLCGVRPTRCATRLTVSLERWRPVPRGHVGLERDAPSLQSV
jgi:hypothetical protein